MSLAPPRLRSRARRCIPAHALKDVAFFVDELGAVHVGTRRDNRVTNPHLLDNLQGRPTHIDLIAANQQVRRPFHDRRIKSVTLQPISDSESCGSGPLKSRHSSASPNPPAAEAFDSRQLSPS